MSPPPLAALAAPVSNIFTTTRRATILDPRTGSSASMMLFKLSTSIDSSSGPLLAMLTEFAVFQNSYNHTIKVGLGLGKPAVQHYAGLPWVVHPMHRHHTVWHSWVKERQPVENWLNGLHQGTHLLTIPLKRAPVVEHLWLQQLCLSTGKAPRVPSRERQHKCPAMGVCEDRAV